MTSHEPPTTGWICPRCERVNAPTERQAIQEPLLQQAHDRAAELRRSIPADHREIQVKISESEELGDTYLLDGIELRGVDRMHVKHIGSAVARMPGQRYPFYAETIASIPRSEADAILERHRTLDEDATAKRIQREADRAAKFQEAKRTGKPVAIGHRMESRRAQEGGEWGDYIFSVTTYAKPDGTTEEKAVNTY